MTCRLLELVDELLLAVVAAVDDLNSLRSLARTCSRLRALAEPAIYCEVFLRGPDDAATLATSIVSRPDRLQAIRSIEARLKYDPQGCRLDTLTSIVHRAGNLREFTLESPYCNRVQSEARHGWAGDMTALLRPVFDFSLTRLSALTLHLSQEDDRYWAIEGSSTFVFAHPTLRSLKLSCASIGNSIAESLEKRPRTPLKRLTLIECGITQDALTSVLALPLALEHLSLGEMTAHRHMQRSGFGRLYATKPVAFLSSLKQQDHALESLGYAAVSEPGTRSLLTQPGSTTDLSFDPLVCTGLSTFHRLTHISLQNSSREFEYVLKTPETAPPSLERLTLTEPRFGVFLRSDSDVRETQSGMLNQWMSWLPATASTIKSLQTIDLIASSVQPQSVEEALTVLKGVLPRRGLSVRMFGRRSMAAIPPFLYREKPYLDEEIYALEDGELQRSMLFKGEVLQGNCIEYS